MGESGCGGYCDISLAEGVDRIGQPFRPQLLRFSGLAGVVAGILGCLLALVLLAFLFAPAFVVRVGFVVDIDSEPGRGPCEGGFEVTAAFPHHEAERVAFPAVAEIDAGAPVRAVDAYR